MPTEHQEHFPSFLKRFCGHHLSLPPQLKAAWGPGRVAQAAPSPHPYMAATAAMSSSWQSGRSARQNKCICCLKVITYLWSNCEILSRFCKAQSRCCHNPASIQVGCNEKCFGLSSPMLHSHVLLSTCLQNWLFQFSHPGKQTQKICWAHEALQLRHPQCHDCDHRL